MVKSQELFRALFCVLFIVFLSITPIFAFSFDDILAFFGMKTATGYVVFDTNITCECSDCASCSQMLWENNNCKVVMLKKDLSFINGTCCVKPPPIISAGRDNPINGKTLDCKAHTIDSEMGLEIKDAQNIAIKNCNIKSKNAFVFENIRNSEISNIQLVVRGYGIRIYNSNNISLKNLNISSDKKKPSTASVVNASHIGANASLASFVGVNISNSQNIILLRSDFSDVGEAIAMVNSSDIVVKNSSIHAVSSGISAQKISNLTFENNKIYSLVPGNLQQIQSCIAMRIADSEELFIKNNIFANTTCDSQNNIRQPIIILIEYSNKTTIYNNTITNNKGISNNPNSEGNIASSYDIIISNSSENLLQDNMIYSNIAGCIAKEGDSCCIALKYGISLDNTSNNTIINNNIKNNTAYQTCGNKTTTSISYGVNIMSSTFNNITANVIVGHTFDLFVRNSNQTSGSGNAGNSASGWSEGGKIGFTYTGNEIFKVQKVSFEKLKQELPITDNRSIGCTFNGGADMRMDYDGNLVVDEVDVALFNATVESKNWTGLCKGACDLDKNGEINEKDIKKFEEYVKNNCKFKISREVEGDELSIKYLLKNVDDSIPLSVYDVYKNETVGFRKGDSSWIYLKDVLSPSNIPVITSIFEGVGKFLRGARGTNAKLYQYSGDSALCSRFDDCVYEGYCYKKNETFAILTENKTGHVRCDALVIYAESEATTCTCNSCTDCNNKLNNASCTIVKLTADITNHAGTCIDNPANFNNKTFDCQGHTIEGNGSESDYGIYLNGKSGNMIKNCVVTHFTYGIYLDNTSFCNLTNNKIIKNIFKGIAVNSSNNIIIKNNEFYENMLVLVYSNYTTIQDNLFNKGEIILSVSGHNTIKSNTVVYSR